MLKPKIGEVMLRVIPPCEGHPGYSQSGYVESFNDEVIVLAVQVDYLRKMRFNRTDGMDTSGIGSFLIHPDLPF